MVIAVAGGGIAGLACTIALSEFAPVMVFERRNTADANSGAGIQLSPNAVHAVRHISPALAARVLSAASEPKGLEIRSVGRAKPLAAIDYGAVMEPRFGAPYLTMGRGALHTALLETARDLPDITIVNDAPVTAVENRGDGWTLNCEPQPFAFLVAADGVNSGVRGAVLGDRPTPTGYVAWRGTGDIPGEATTLTMMGGRHLVRYALAHGGDNVVFVEKGAAGTRPAGSQNPAVADVHNWVPWPISVREPHWFGHGTLAAVGDAAHAMVPFLAQGGAMALEDAAVLKSAVTHHGLSADAVAAYAAARKPRTERAAAQANQQGLLYHLPAPFSWARNVGIAAAGERGVLARVDWIYSWRPTTI